MNSASLSSEKWERLTDFFKNKNIPWSYLIKNGATPKSSGKKRNTEAKS